MANALAALGRSNAMQNTMGMLGSISAYKQGEARIAVNEEIAEKMKRQAAVEEEARVKAKKLNPVAGLASRFRGGENSTNWKMALEIATSKGMINNDSGQPAISNEDEGIMGEFLGTPAMQRKIQANKISDIENEMKALKSQEAEGEDGKPGKKMGPKELEQYNKLDKERIAAYADNIALVQYQKAQYDKAKAATLAAEKEKAAKLKEERAAETSRVTAQRAVYAEDIKAKALLKHQRAQRATTLAAARMRQGKTPSSGEAVTKVASLTKAKATFDKTEKMDVLMAGLFPDMAKQKGGITKEQKAEVYAAYDEAIAYYKDFVPKDEKRQKAIVELKRQNKPITDANIDFIMSHIE